MKIKKKNLFMASVELKGFQKLKELDERIRDNKQQSVEDLDSFVMIPTENLKRGKFQPRKHIKNDKLLQELALSIERHGIIQPLIVRKLENNKFDIIAGERRWRAAGMLGLKKVPAVIRNVDDGSAFAFAMVENIQREDFNCVEEARGFFRFQKEFNMTHDEIAEIVGRSRSSITNAIRLLSLADSVKEFLNDKKLEMGHARALLSLSAQEQELFSNRIVEKQLTVRETEALIQAYRNSSPNKQTKKENQYKQEINQWVKGFEKALSTAVKIKLNNKGEGSVTIPVSSPDEIKWLLKVVSEKT